MHEHVSSIVVLLVAEAEVLLLLYFKRLENIIKKLYFLASH